MKFTKEEARKKLAEMFSTKVKEIGKWERTINENVENLFSIIGENDTMTVEEFAEKAIPFLNTTSGFLNKEMADTARTYEERMEELKKAKSAEDANKGGGHESELEKRIAELEKRNKEIEFATAVSEKKSRIIDIAKEKGVKNDEWLGMMIGKVTIGDDTDVDREAEDFVKMYNKFVATSPQNVTPKGAGGKSEDYQDNVIKAAGGIAKSQQYLQQNQN